MATASRGTQIRLDKASLALIERAKILYDRATLYGALVRFFDHRAGLIADDIARDVAANHKISGDMARSIAGRGELVGGRIPGMRVGGLRGPALRYFGVQEHGTKGKDSESPYPTIVPKKGKALSIPVDRGTGKRALTLGGVSRYSGAGADPRDLSFVPLHGKRLIGGLFETKSLQQERKRAAREKRPLDLDKARLAWMLVSAVDIEPKHFLRDGFARNLPDLMSQLTTFLAEIVALRSRPDLRAAVTGLRP